MMHRDESPRTAVRGRGTDWWGFGLALVIAAVCCAASDLDEFKVKREGPFEFAQKPTVARDGDRVTIAFEAKAFCDATVAVEDEKGRIVRHLASGVLGPNAPAPFRKNAKRQTVAWDGKDDKGTYIDDTDKVVLRVSLGLKPRFERTLFWEPKKRIAPKAPIIRAAEEGVYVYEGWGLDHLRLFDHEGDYVRTIYPFPASRLATVRGLEWAEFPHVGSRQPLKRGSRETTLLTSGSNGRPSAEDRTDEYKSAESHAASAFALSRDHIALAMHSLNRLALGRSTGGLNLHGPSVECVLPAGGGDRTPHRYVPGDAAFSPDGRTLYLTGHSLFRQRNPWIRWIQTLHGVARLTYAEDAKPEVFKGSLAPKGSGTDNEHFNAPLSVDCDAKGNVYVADYLNDRVQVFAAAGAFVRSVRTPKPVVVRVKERTNRLYVFSWLMPLHATVKGVKVDPKMTVFGPLDDPREQASYDLPFVRKGRLHSGFHMGTARDYWAEVDPYTDPPTIWLGLGMQQSDWGRGEFGEGQRYSAPAWRTRGLRLLVPKDESLEVRRDFAADTIRSVKRARPPRRFAQHLFVNPRSGKLYVLEYLGRGSGMDGCDELIELDPVTGGIRLVKLPFVFEDLAFDRVGRAYFQSQDVIFRYDLETRREVPFDYGVERTLAGGFTVRSGIHPRGLASWHHWAGKMAVSPRGHVGAAVRGYGVAGDRRGDDKPPKGANEWKPALFPGRAVGEYLFVWDDRGRLLHTDALPGITGWMTGGLALDKDDDLYLVLNSRHVAQGKATYRPKTGVLVRATPGRTVLLSPAKSPVPLPRSERPARLQDLAQGWLKHAKWTFGGVGFNTSGFHCLCWHTSLAVDAFNRSFAPQPNIYRIAVLDANGNVITRIGRYGNVDDGLPLVRQGGVPKPRALGPSAGSGQAGDEVALFTPNYVAADTDRRLFIADAGNGRILSVRLNYHATERVALKEVTDDGS